MQFIILRGEFLTSNIYEIIHCLKYFYHFIAERRVNVFRIRQENVFNKNFTSQ